MAYYNNNKTTYLKSSDSYLFDLKWGPGEEVEQSGIYRCTSCGLEAACNKGDHFPPQNSKQHPKKEDDIQWKLVVATNSLED